jgi:hypothetical protein
VSRRRHRRAAGAIGVLLASIAVLAHYSREEDGGVKANDSAVPVSATTSSASRDDATTTDNLLSEGQIEISRWRQPPDRGHQASAPGQERWNRVAFAAPAGAVALDGEVLRLTPPADFRWPAGPASADGTPENPDSGGAGFDTARGFDSRAGRIPAHEPRGFRPQHEDASFDHLRPLPSGALTPRGHALQTFAVNAEAAGNSLAVGDVRVRVERSLPATDDEDALIEVSVIEKPANAAEATPRAAIELRGARPVVVGLTHEEELFRTKWGWAAFAEAQRIGRRIGGSEP